ncbi:MAG: Mov34/MPN/PAD-1 family protein [Thermoproteota archaeon]
MACEGAGEVAVKRGLVEAVKREVLGSPAERVYLAVGRSSTGRCVVERVVECPNVARNPALEFLADPECVYRIYMEAEREGREVVAIIHSHPAAPQPSLKDLRGMQRWPVPWIIFSSLNGSYAAWIVEGSEVKRLRVIEES